MKIKVIRQYIAPVKAPKPKKSGSPMTLGVSETEREQNPYSSVKTKRVSAVDELDAYLEKTKSSRSTEVATKSMASTAPTIIGRSGEPDVYQFKSKSKPSRTPYELLVFPDKSMSCNCPRWTNKRGSERDCPHTREMQQKYPHRRLYSKA